MGFLDSILGRRAPRPPDLDALFQIPSAALSLVAAHGLHPTGTGAVCYRGAAGPAFEQVQRDVLDLLAADGTAPSVDVSRDSFGFTWTVLDTHAGGDSDLGSLCTALHAVNTSLESQGFASGLLCTVVPFADAAGRRVALVYLYKQGTFYPFAPAPGAGAVDPRRDTMTEFGLRDTLAGELPVEKDVQRWMALWDAPGL